jgi:hypothetical protein
MIERPTPCSSHSDDDDSDENAHELYPYDLLSRMFSAEMRTPPTTRATPDVHAESVGGRGAMSVGGRGAMSDALPTTLLERMFETLVVDVASEDNIGSLERSDGDDARMLARMFDAPMLTTASVAKAESDDAGPTEDDRVAEDDRYARPSPADVQSAVPTMSILETNERALSALPLSSRMFETSEMEERHIISQYEFQSIIREIVSVRHTIRDHVIQLRHLRALHRKHEEKLHEMLQQVNQDGVRSCDYPLLFYMSRRTKRSVNKQVHQSEQLQAFMKSRGIHMSDVERKDLISLIKKESVIKKTEGMIRSVPIDGRG